MSATVALVASTTGDERAPLVAARLRHLLDAGWDAWLFCKGDRWRDEPALRDSAVRERVALAPDAKVDSSPFDDRLKDLCPDLVHFHSGWAAFKGLRDGQLPDAEIVIRFRADGQDLAVPNPELLWKRASRLVFPDEASLDRALERGWPPERAVVMQAPVEPRGEDDRLPREPGTLRVLSAAALTWQQGFEHSIHAVRLLLDAGVRCGYRIVGDGDHAQAVAFARHQLGVGEHVELVSPDGADQLSEELRAADVVLDPAVADTSSLTLATGLAHGVPFVATARSTPLSAEAGITVPRRDPRAIATALARLARDPALLERLGQAGPVAAGICISQADHFHEVERLYEATLAEVARR